MPSDYNYTRYFHCYQQHCIWAAEITFYLQPQILEYYNQLNDIGRHKATEQVKDLTYIPQYRAGSEPLLNAAHEIAGASEEDQQHDDDIMNDDF